MRVAALYDIHGNLPALEAVLEEIRQLNVDLIMVGGDVVLGPMSSEVLSCLVNLSTPVRFIQGNCEVAVLAQMAGQHPGPLPEQVLETVRWTANQLLAEQERLMASWPKTMRIDMSGLGEVLFCHATPRSETEYFTRLTPAERLLPIFEGLNVPIVICGHTHMQFDRMIGRVRVINAGSVGMPFGQPGAYWLLLGSVIELRHTPYDLLKAAGRIAATTYPQAQHFALHNVLQPPSEDDMLTTFTRVELSL